MSYSDNLRKFEKIVAETNNIDSQLPKAQAVLPFPIRTPTKSTTEDETPPLYSQVTSDVLESLEQLAVAIREAGDALPIAAYPQLNGDAANGNEEKILRRQRIVSIYYDAIGSGDCDSLAVFLTSKLVTTSTTDRTGRTPLIAAIQKRRIATVRFLTSLGADVNVYGITTTTVIRQTRRGKPISQHIYRTPLQCAAELGLLPIVKLLMDSGADDSLIAPDGQLALRLAAINGHREIVAYLPSRRGGGVNRWKAKHATSMRRCKKAVRGMYKFGKFFVWDTPRFFIWTVPKYMLVLPVVESVKWLRDHWKEIPGYVADLWKEVVQALKQLPGAIWSTIKGLPSFVVDVIKALGKCAQVCAKGLLKFMRGIPHAVEVSMLWLFAGVFETGAAIGHVLTRLFSLVYVLITGILDSFSNLAPDDVWRGFVSISAALFVEAPKTLWGWMSSFGEVALKALKALLGSLGKCIWFILKGTLDLIMFVPKKCGEIVAACVSSARSGGKEVLVWVDPKRV